MEPPFEHLDRLSDEQVIETVKTFADNERNAIADLIAGLAVIEHRRLYLGQGASSLYSYCVDVWRWHDRDADAHCVPGRVRFQQPCAGRSVREMTTAARSSVLRGAARNEGCSSSIT